MKKILTVFCLAISAGTATFMLHYANHPAQLGPAGTTLLAVAALVFMVTGITGFVLAMWRRGGQPRQHPLVRSNLIMNQPKQYTLKDGPYGLIPGARYRVIRAITDHYNTVFPVGEELTFIERHYLPYESGHTLVFDKRSMYLQDGTSAALSGFDTYLMQIAGPVDLVKVISGLAAHFKQPDGSSRPGVDWKMTLTESPATIFFVHTLYAPLVSPSKSEEVRLRQRAITFANMKLAAGWCPGPGERIEVVPFPG